MNVDIKTNVIKRNGEEVRFDIRQHRTNSPINAKEHITMNYNQKTFSKSSHMRTNSDFQTMSVSQNKKLYQ